jgi:L,D-peptidoglycan transpeptidase YkuD (ErfK/YbiS/YcfS/YnhG family)
VQTRHGTGRHQRFLGAAGALVALVFAAVCLGSAASAATAKAPAASPAPAESGAATILPDRMKSTLDALQLIVVTGAELGSRRGSVRLYDRSTGAWVQRFKATARFGRKGLADGLKRHEGAGTTPTGVWRMSQFAFGRHTAAPKGCTLKWRRIKATSWWSSVRDRSYNTWVETTHRIDGEHLIAVGAPYEYAVHTGFNALPNKRVLGRGSAIFIHVVHAGYSSGCVMLARKDMIALLRLLKADRRLACAIGTTRAGTATSITAY